MNKTKWKLTISYITSGSFTTIREGGHIAKVLHDGIKTAIRNNEPTVEFLDLETGRIDTILVNQIRAFWIEPIETK